jgi:hypothetical protein
MSDWVVSYGEQFLIIGDKTEPRRDEERKRHCAGEGKPFAALGKLCGLRFSAVKSKLLPIGEPPVFGIG